MSWIVLAFLSAMLLGCYDIAKKASVRDNAVPAVLLVNVATAAIFWLCPIGYSVAYKLSGTAPPSPIGVHRLIALARGEHGLLFLKSLLVGCSWICAFFVAVSEPDALISVISPVRRSAVVIPFLFGVVYCKEPNWHLNAACITANLTGVYLLSQAA